jgi:hypothetical protein
VKTGDVHKITNFLLGRPFDPQLVVGGDYETPLPSFDIVLNKHPFKIGEHSTFSFVGRRGDAGK